MGSDPHEARMRRRPPKGSTWLEELFRHGGKDLILDIHAAGRWAATGYVIAFDDETVVIEQTSGMGGGQVVVPRAAITRVWLPADGRYPWT